MTKQEFLVVSDLLAKYNFDELDRLEFVMCFERETKSSIPDEWFAEASLPKPEERTDWDAFRREAAKDILAGFAANGKGINRELDVAFAIQLADELIKQLKEDEK